MTKQYATNEHIDFARHLRQDATDAEAALWQCLRSRQLGVKFRRQHPIGHYTVDFACEEARLIVELDGGQHNDAAHQTYDKKRSKHLEQSNWRILRFWNNDVLENMDGVVQTIQDALTRNHQK